MMTEVTYKNAGIISHGISKLVRMPELLMLYLGVPMALLFVYLLPVGIKEQFFTLHLDHPMILALLTNAFNHDLYQHLASNLIYYILALTAIIAIETSLQRFQYMTLTIFVAVPIISSAATVLYFAGAGYGQLLGFSGIVSGYMGYVIYLIVEKMYQVTPMAKPHAFVIWVSLSSLIILATAASIGVISIYQIGHLSNGVGHLIGYTLGLLLCYIMRP